MADAATLPDGLPALQQPPARQQAPLALEQQAASHTSGLQLATRFEASMNGRRRVNGQRRPTNRDGSHEERKARWKAKQLQANPNHIPRSAALPRVAKRKLDRTRAEACCRRCRMGQDEHTEMGRGTLQKHHVVSLCDGGHPTDPENLVTLCYFCHRCACTRTHALALLVPLTDRRPPQCCLMHGLEHCPRAHREWHEFWERESSAVEGDGGGGVSAEEELEEEEEEEEEQLTAKVADMAAVVELKGQWALYMAACPYRQTVMFAESGGPRALSTTACARCAMPAERCAELRPQRKQPLHPFVEEHHGDGDATRCVCYFCQREWAIFWRILRPDARLFFCSPPFRPVSAPRGQMQIVTRIAL